MQHVNLFLIHQLLSILKKAIYHYLDFEILQFFCPYLHLMFDHPFLNMQNFYICNNHQEYLIMSSFEKISILYYRFQYVFFLIIYLKFLASLNYKLNVLLLYMVDLLLYLEINMDDYKPFLIALKYLIIGFYPYLLHLLYLYFLIIFVYTYFFVVDLILHIKIFLFLAVFYILFHFLIFLIQKVLIIGEFVLLFSFVLLQ